MDRINSVHFIFDERQRPPEEMRVADNNLTPTRKVGASALAGAITVVLVWVLNTVVLPENNKITGEVASALTLILTFVVGYFVPEAVDPAVAWSKMEPMLLDQRFQWRKVVTLAGAASISSRAATDILRHRPHVRIGQDAQGEPLAQLTQRPQQGQLQAPQGQLPPAQPQPPVAHLPPGA